MGAFVSPAVVARDGPFTARKGPDGLGMSSLAQRQMHHQRQQPNQQQSQFQQQAQQQLMQNGSQQNLQFQDLSPGMLGWGLEGF